MLNDDDKTYCKSIAKSISDIIRFSLDEEFRKKSFELFGVTSTVETETKINERLITLIENKNSGCLCDKVILKNKNGTSRKKKDKQNTYSHNNVIVNKETNLISNTNSNSQSTRQNVLTRKQLQIPSQQYRQKIKRKKLNYYSQPEINLMQHQNELFSCNFDSCNSQPSMPCSSLIKKAKYSSLEGLDNGVNYCKKKFRASLKENAQKYFKKNLKCHTH